ncbi:MAG: G5 domain-containing protein, partial [Lachnospiraceae bacterium]|nr:G5 domain-containing protein [Lachnospiraceae bacterium]
MSNSTVLKRSKKRIARLRGYCLALLIGLFFLPSYVPYKQPEANFWHLTLNGQEAGFLAAEDNPEECLIQAKKAIGKEAGEMVLLQSRLVLTPETLLWGKADSKEDVVAKMTEILKQDSRLAVRSAYTVKIGTMMVNLRSTQEITALLQAALDLYENNRQFVVLLENDPEREFNVLTAKVVPAGSLPTETEDSLLPEGGVWAMLDSQEEVSEEEKDFAEYDLGLVAMDFKEKVEIVEASLSEADITSLQDAIQKVTVMEDVPTVYKVEPGDTLSGIAMKKEVPMETLVEMNPDLLENVNSVIRAGDELTITIPEPNLSVVWQDRRHYEEDYDEPVQYVPNDQWYTNQTKTLQEPSAGHREVIALVTFTNAEESRVIIEKQEVELPAVAKVVERGTKIPPSYIRPVAGGRISSGFGSRKRPTKGAS